MHICRKECLRIYSGQRSRCIICQMHPSQLPRVIGSARAPRIPVVPVKMMCEMFDECNIWIPRLACMCVQCRDTVRNSGRHTFDIDDDLLEKYDCTRHRIDAMGLQRIRQRLHALAGAKKPHSRLNRPLTRSRGRVEKLEALNEQLRDDLTKYGCHRQDEQLNDRVLRVQDDWESYIRYEKDTQKFYEELARKYSSKKSEKQAVKRRRSKLGPLFDLLDERQSMQVQRNTTASFNCIVFHKFTDTDCKTLSRLTRTQLQGLAQETRRPASQLFHAWYRMYRFKTWREQAMIVGMSVATLRKQWKDSLDVLYAWSSRHVMHKGRNEKFTRDFVWKHQTNVSKIVWGLHPGRLGYVMDGGYQHCRRVHSLNTLFVCLTLCSALCIHQIHTFNIC